MWLFLVYFHRCHSKHVALEALSRIVVYTRVLYQVQHLSKIADRDDRTELPVSNNEPVLVVRVADEVVRVHLHELDVVLVLGQRMPRLDDVGVELKLLDRFRLLIVGMLAVAAYIPDTNRAVV